MRRQGVRAVALGVVLALGSPAMAARGEDAAALHRQAIAHAKDKRFAEAAQAFGAEYALTKKPDLLFNIAECHRLLYAETQRPEALAEARRAYGRYIEASPDGKMVDKAREWQRTLDEEARKHPAPAPVPPPPAPTPAPASRPDLEVKTAPASPATPAPPLEEDTPVYKKWWLWTAVGVVAAGAITGIVIATRPKNVEVPGARDFDPMPFR